MQWDYIKNFHLNPPLTADCLPRHKDLESKYQQHKEEIQSDGKSIKDYIISTHFNDSYLIERGWVITKNDFPYDLDPSIQHLLIWIYPGKDFSDKQIIEFIEKYMEEKGHVEYVYYRNNFNIRSILDLDHFHIFIKNSSLSGQTP